MIIEDHELTPPSLGPVLDELLADDERREAMAHNSRLVDHGAAAETVARWAIELTGRNRPPDRQGTST